MNMPTTTGIDATTAAQPADLPGTAFGCPRDFIENRFVYVVVSPRARGLSVGVNLNPDKFCNFDCAYCEVNRAEPARESKLEVGVDDNRYTVGLNYWLAPTTVFKVAYEFDHQDGPNAEHHNGVLMQFVTGF